MIKINVITSNINWLKFIKKPNHYLNKKISKLNLSENKFKKNKFYCTLLLSGNREITNLNKRFRKKNKTTDILSFPFQTFSELKKKIKKGEEIYLGDIIINFNKISDKKMIKYFEFEFDRLWIHGLLHLFGYNHKRDADFEKMLRVEKKYFKLVND